MIKLKCQVWVVITLAVLCIIVILIEFWPTHWTDKQREEFALSCSKTEFVDNLYFSVTGFSYKEVENIRVNIILDGKIIDSLYVHADQKQYDSSRRSYSIWLYKKIYLKDTYEFIISGQKPFVLSDMKMVMWPTFTEFSEGYQCIMGDYKTMGLVLNTNQNQNL